MIIDDPWFYLWAVPAVLLTGISKAGFGGAVGGLAVPMMSLAVAPPVAVAIVLPILCIMDAMGLVAFRGRYDARILKLVIPAGVAGTLLGLLLFRYVDARWVKGLIGVESILFALHRLREGSQAWAGPPRALRAGPARFWSMLSGFTSFISHAGGPPMMQFIMPLKLDRVLMVGTLTWYFASINAAKWIPYAWLGLFDARNFGTSAALLPVVPLGYWLGLRVLTRLDQVMFVRVATWLLLATGVKLCWDAVG